MTRHKRDRRHQPAWRDFLRRAMLAFVALASAPSLCRATDDVGGPLITFNDNGAWSWFQDERAFVDMSAGATGKIIVSSIANGAGAGGASRNADVEVVSYDLTTAALNRFTLADSLEADDHDSAALLKLPDGRYLASYSKHSTNPTVHWRISSSPGNITSWNAESVYTESGNTTYSNLAYLSASGDVFDFHRVAGAVGGYDPNYLKWNLASQSGFAFGGRLLTGPEGNSGSSDRPYVRYTTNGIDRIDFITTDAHPRNLLSNGVYHGYIKFEGGSSYGVYKSDGTRLGDLSQATTSDYHASDFTPLLVGNAVAPANGLLMTRSWTTDVQIDSAGNPYAVFTARVNDNVSDHRFFYGRYTDSGWNIHELAKAGAFLYSSENDYTGLVALDPNDPNRLFMSSKIDPRNQSSLPHYEIFQGKTTDGGANWHWDAITANSTMDNIRPIVPSWDTNHTALLWLRGTYSSYKSYNMSVVGLTSIAPLNTPLFGDLNGDQEIDLLDWDQYIHGLHADLSGMTPDDAREHGDLNGDGVNDYLDFILFRQVYVGVNGEADFAALAAENRLPIVPEPDTAGLLLIGCMGAMLMPNPAASKQTVEVSDHQSNLVVRPTKTVILREPQRPKDLVCAILGNPPVTNTNRDSSSRGTPFRIFQFSTPHFRQLDH
jgi:hypothetical protein